MLKENNEFDKILPNSPSYLFESKWQINCIQAFNEGFVVAGGNLQILVYKQTDDIDYPYRIFQKIQLRLSDFRDVQIKSMAIPSNNEERVMCFLSNSTICAAKIKQDDVLIENEGTSEQFEYITSSFHSNNVYFAFTQFRFTA